jgi:elongation factor Ts
MTKITASEVNKLRQQTGAGMMDCKNALVEAEGDFETAIDILRKKGQKVAAKRADRETTEGAVLAMTSSNHQSGVILCLNCETDFVAKNDNFITLAQTFISLALENDIQDLDSLKSLDFDGSMSVGEKLVEQTGVIGEKLELSNYSIISADYVTAYIHPGNKLASLVGFNMSSVDDIEEIGKNIAMQIAAMNPVGLDEADITQDIIDKEIEIGKDLARQEGKPEEMLEKIAMGRLKKFFKENTLINQTYIKDSKKTVMQYLKDANTDLSIVSFKRVSLG